MVNKLASIYSEVAEAVEDETEEFKNIIRVVEDSASKGNFSTKIKIEKEVKDWVDYDVLRPRMVKPDLIYKLEEHGFTFGSAQMAGYNEYTMLISWRKK